MVSVGVCALWQRSKAEEFPDAFAIASLALYANKEGANVAVVAHDQDFKGACSREPRLLHFSSLPELTQLLLSETEDISSFVEALTRNEDTITLAIVEAVEGSRLRHADERVSVTGHGVEEVNLIKLSVMAVGEKEFTFAFRAEVRCAVDANGMTSKTTETMLAMLARKGAFSNIWRSRELVYFSYLRMAKRMSSQLSYRTKIGT